MLVLLLSKDGWALTDFSLAESSNMRSNGFLTGSIPSTNTCNHTETSALQLHQVTSHTEQLSSSYYICNKKVHNQKLIVVDASLNKPGWLKGAPGSSSSRWCPGPRGRRNGCGVYWRYVAWPGSASWCRFLYGLTPVTIKNYRKHEHHITDQLLCNQTDPHYHAAIQMNGLK